MKKISGLIAGALVLAGLLTGCASTGGAKAPASVHPRDYTFDLIDTGATIKIEYNQYGPNYQAKCDLTNLVKKDRPQVGDTVYVKMRAVSDIDLPVLQGCLVDPSAAANYWKQLGEFLTIAEDIKAGEPFDIDLAIEISDTMVSEFHYIMQYDTADQTAPKVNAPAVLTLERVCESTDTRNEVASAPHKTVLDVDIGKVCPLVEVKVNHPWINGVEQTKVIENYRASVLLEKAYGDDTPVAGDTINFTWKGKADADIKKMRAYLVDQSEAAAWWKQLTAEEDTVVFIEDIKNGEPFEASFTLKLAADPVKQVNLVMEYDIGDATPDGSAIILVVRD